MTAITIHHDTDEAQIALLAGTIGSSGWIILESYSQKVVFETYVPGSPLPTLGEEFAGRIFGPDAEVRWLRDSSGFHLWHLAAAENGDAYEMKQRNYYALGYWKNGHFFESSLPAPIAYPVPPDPKLHDEDRPYFVALEYYRQPPSVWPGDPAAVQALLNQPRLVAYRLIAFQFGQESARELE